MKFFVKIKKLWFPNKKIKVELLKLKKSYTKKLEPHINDLNVFKKTRKSTVGNIRILKIALNDNIARLGELENCFDEKDNLFESLNSNIQKHKSIKSNLSAAYDTLKKNKASESDYFKWAERNPKIYNGYSGRRGKKIRNDFNPMGIFNKYTTGDLSRFKRNIASAGSSIDSLKSQRSRISSKIDSIKSEINRIKELCNYVKTVDGKQEIKNIKDIIIIDRNKLSDLNSTLENQDKYIDSVKVKIKTVKSTWNTEIRKIKLSEGL